MQLPSNRAINKQRVARFHEKISQGLASNELETFQSIIEHYARENDVPMEMIAASLAVLANGETSLLAREELKPASFTGDPGRNGDRERFSKERRSGWRRAEGRMETYRIEVGRRHQVQAGNIVGAIANEAGIGSESIGKIKIFERFSTVDLPEGFPHDRLDALRDVCIGGRKIRISRMDDTKSRGTRTPNGKRPKKGRARFARASAR
jgi:ATP-dependent RNA helicase DeaD